MKKVGILTIFRTGNYGATLQAYAQKQAICENGFADAEIINYCCDAVKQKIDRRFLREAGLFRTAVACVERIYYFPRMKKTIGFVNSYAPGKELTREELPALNDKYDIFLSGSDQIWNTDIQQGDTSYFLDFVTDPEKKRSYASSFGLKSVNSKYRERVTELLSQYKRITVREQTGVEIVRDLLGKDAELVIDPALLLTPEQWKSKLPPRKFKGDYVFAYQMAHSPLIGKIVTAGKKALNAKSVFVPFPILGFCVCRPTLGLSSLEWARAIHDSKFVVTDSFHGAVFAILFRKPFYYVITSDTVRKRLSRLETLLSSLEIEGRLVSRVEDCDFTREIDYDRVHELLDRQRDRSLAILKELVSDDCAPSAPYVKPIPTDKHINKRPDECCGCTACYGVCPTGAITMHPDSEGFLYPVIDSAKCVDCGKCVSACAFQKDYGRADGLIPQEYYGMVHKDPSIRKTSRSGGAFMAFSDVILHRGGTVFGVALNEAKEAVYVSVSSREELPRLQGSKYVQAVKGEIYREVRQVLSDGKWALFGGTACEVAGLLSYLRGVRADTSRLVTCDIICHGVPSPLIWQENLRELEEKWGKIDSLSFRDKSFGWHSHIESYRVGKKTRYANTYTALFYSHLCLRPSCGECKFCNYDRPGDLTVADFWGSEKLELPFDRSTGVSLLMIHTEKGKTLIEEAKESVELTPVQREQTFQPNLGRPTAHAYQRDAFWADLKRDGYVKTARRYSGIMTKVRFIYNMIFRRKRK